MAIGVCTTKRATTTHGANNLAKAAARQGIGLCSTAPATTNTSRTTPLKVGFRKAGALVDEAGDDTFSTPTPAIPRSAAIRSIERAAPGRWQHVDVARRWAKVIAPTVDPGYEHHGLGMGVLRDAPGAFVQRRVRSSVVVRWASACCSKATATTREGLWYVQGVAHEHPRPRRPTATTSTIKRSQFARRRLASIPIIRCWRSSPRRRRRRHTRSRTFARKRKRQRHRFDGRPRRNSSFRADAVNTLGSANCGDLQGTARAPLQTLGVFGVANGADSYQSRSIDAKPDRIGRTLRLLESTAASTRKKT